MTPEKEFLLVKLNQDAAAAHAEATGKAEKMGKTLPAPLVPLKPENIEFPKWLHKGWKEKAGGAPGHSEAEESKLVHDEAALKEALAAGWTEGPMKAAKKEAAKKE